MNEIRDSYFILQLFMYNNGTDAIFRHSNHIKFLMWLPCIFRGK